MHTKLIWWLCTSNYLTINNYWYKFLGLTHLIYAMSYTRQKSGNFSRFKSGIIKVGDIEP